MLHIRLLCANKIFYLTLLTYLHLYRATSTRLPIYLTSLGLHVHYVAQPIDIGVARTQQDRIDTATNIGGSKPITIGQR